MLNVELCFDLSLYADCSLLYIHVYCTIAAFFFIPSLVIFALGACGLFFMSDLISNDFQWVSLWFSLDAYLENYGPWDTFLVDFLLVWFWSQDSQCFSTLPNPIHIIIVSLVTSDDCGRILITFISLDYFSD